MSITKASSTEAPPHLAGSSRSTLLPLTVIVTVHFSQHGNQRGLLGSTATEPNEALGQ